MEEEEEDDDDNDDDQEEEAESEDESEEDDGEAGASPASPPPISPHPTRSRLLAPPPAIEVEQPRRAARKPKKKGFFSCCGGHLEDVPAAQDPRPSKPKLEAQLPPPLPPPSQPPVQPKPGPTLPPQRSISQEQVAIEAQRALPIIQAALASSTPDAAALTELLEDYRGLEHPLVAGPWAELGRRVFELRAEDGRVATKLARAAGNSTVTLAELESLLNAHRDNKDRRVVKALSALRRKFHRLCLQAEELRGMARAQVHQHMPTY